MEKVRALSEALDLTSGQRELLRLTLQLAVPLWIERLKDWPMSAIVARANDCGQEVASHGDVIQFRSKKRDPATASAFNRLAEGLACAALVSGAVTFLGVRFES